MHDVLEALLAETLDRSSPDGRVVAQYVGHERVPMSRGRTAVMVTARVSVDGVATEGRVFLLALPDGGGTEEVRVGCVSRRRILEARLAEVPADWTGPLEPAELLGLQRPPWG